MNMPTIEKITANDLKVMFCVSALNTNRDKMPMTNNRKISAKQMMLPISDGDIVFSARILATVLRSIVAGSVNISCGRVERPFLSRFVHFRSLSPVLTACASISSAFSSIPITLNSPRKIYSLNRITQFHKEIV